MLFCGTCIQFSARLQYNHTTAQNRILNHGFIKDNVHNVYMLPFLILKETKLIAFQFKIIHYILPTQVSLYRAGLTDNDICPLCSCEPQTLAHMLCYCNESSRFWNQFINWWHETFKEQITLHESVILYGWHKEKNNKKMLNYILVIAKYHIFATSTCNGTLSFESFLLRLKNKLDILRTIANENNTLDAFLNNWAAAL